MLIGSLRLIRILKGEALPVWVRGGSRNVTLSGASAMGVAVGSRPLSPGVDGDKDTGAVDGS